MAIDDIPDVHDCGHEAYRSDCGFCRARERQEQRKVAGLDAIGAHEDAMKRFHRARALGDWAQAKAIIRAAITSCPVDEALPTLAGYLKDCEEKTKSYKFLWWRIRL